MFWTKRMFTWYFRQTFGQKKLSYFCNSLCFSSVVMMLKWLLCRRHTRFWNRVLIYDLHLSPFFHYLMLSLQISEFVVDKQAHVWLLHAETTSAVKSMPCLEYRKKKKNRCLYDSSLMLAWASIANIFTIEVNIVIRLHNSFSLKTAQQLCRWTSISAVKIKGFPKPLALSIKLILWTDWATNMNDTSNHAGCWEKVCCNIFLIISHIST